MRQPGGRAKVAIIGNQAFAMRNFRGPFISALVEVGVRVFALAPDYSADDRAYIETLGAVPVDYRLTRAGVDPIGDIATAAQLFRMLKSLDVDATLSFGAKPAIYGTFAASFAGVGHRVALIEGLGHAFISTGIKGGLLRAIVTALYRVSLRRADEVLFLNSDDLEDFVNWNVVLPERAYKLGAIGVNLDIWRMDPPPVMPTTFLFVARLLKEKGIVEFIEAARRVRAVNGNARFVVLGAPDRNPSSVGRSDVEHWTREGLIQWPGHTDVRPWMEQCSVFVLPSYREGVPRSTQEAAAAGRPIITTNVPGCRDTVINGVSGYLVPPKDPSALEEAMLRFLADPASILRMGRASRVLAEERFDVVQANRILMSFLLRKPELAQ